MNRHVRTFLVSSALLLAPQTLLLAQSESSQAPTPIEAPFSAEIDALRNQSVWRVDSADRADPAARGPVPIGNGFVFACLGLGSAGCNLAAITGPRYGAGDVEAVGEGAFGALTIELIDSTGKVVALPHRRVARVTEQGIAVAEDRGDGIALRMVAYAPPLGTSLIAVIDVEAGGAELPLGMSLRVTTARRADIDGDALIVNADSVRARVTVSGATPRDGALVAAVGRGKRSRSVLEIATGTTTAWNPNPPLGLDAARRALDETIAHWNQTLARTPTLDSDHLRVKDLFRDWKVNLLALRCATTGAIVPMLGRRVMSLRKQNGALVALLRLRLFDEAKQALEFTWDAIRANGKLEEEVRLDVDRRAAANPQTATAEFWRALPMPPAELPSFVLLQHYWYWRATHDVSTIDAHWSLLESCIKRPVRGEDSMMPFSGDEPWLPSRMYAKFGDRLGSDPRLFGDAAALDRTNWSLASAVSFMLSVQAYGELADARDALKRPAAWQSGKPENAPSDTFLRRAIGLMQEIEKRFWIADLSRFAPAVSPVDGLPIREVLANANLTPLWIGWTFPTGEKSRDNLRNSLAGLWQHGARIGTTRTVPISTGDLPGMLLVALAERDDARRLDVVDELLREAEPTGSFAAWIDADGRPLDPDGDGPLRAELLDPGVGGLNFDAIFFALTGIRHASVPNWDDDDIRLELRLPNGSDFVSLRGAEKDGRVLDVFFRRSRSKLTEEERKVNDEASPDRRRDPDAVHERLRFVVEMLEGNPKEGYYHADIDAMGTMFVRFLKPAPPTAEGEHDFRRIEEMEFSKRDELQFLQTRDGEGAAPLAAMRTIDAAATTLVLSCRPPFADAVRSKKVTIVDTGSPLSLAELDGLLLAEGRPRHASLLLDWEFDAPAPAQWNGAVFQSAAWQDLLARYRSAGGVVLEPGFLREAKLDGATLTARADGAFVIPTGPEARKLIVPLPNTTARELVLRTGSSVGMRIRLGARELCANPGRTKAAPDREAVLFRRDADGAELEVEIDASPAEERVVFLRLAGTDGLPAR